MSQLSPADQVRACIAAYVQSTAPPEEKALRPGEVLHIHADGSIQRQSVFEVATDPATAGEKEFAIFECLRRSELARCRQRESST